MKIRLIIQFIGSIYGGTEDGIPSLKRQAHQSDQRDIDYNGGHVL